MITYENAHFQKLFHLKLGSLTYTYHSFLQLLPFHTLNDPYLTLSFEKFHYIF